MSEVQTFEHVIEMLRGMNRIFWLGMAFSLLWYLSRYGYRDWALEHEPDGTLPGLIETRRYEVKWINTGVLPDVVGGILAVISGMAAYMLGAFVVILAQAISVLVFGFSPPHMNALYTAAGFGLIVAAAVQFIATPRIRSSRWYLGY